MYSDVVNNGIACSSLLIGGIDSGYCSRLTVEKNRAEWNDFIQALSARAKGHANTYSVVCVSTTSLQDIAEKFFKEFGFVPSKAVINAKNGTTCTFWVLDIPTFFATLTKECKALNLPAPLTCHSTLA